MYAIRKNNELIMPDSNVQFKVSERLQRFCIWVNQNFLFSTDVAYEGGPKLTLTLKCLRDDSNLIMVFETPGKITFNTFNMQLAADLVHSLTNFLNIDHLEVSNIFLTKISFTYMYLFKKHCLGIILKKRKFENGSDRFLHSICFLENLTRSGISVALSSKKNFKISSAYLYP